MVLGCLGCTVPGVALGCHKPKLRGFLDPPLMVCFNERGRRRESHFQPRIHREAAKGAKNFRQESLAKDFLNSSTEALIGLNGE